MQSVRRFSTSIICQAAKKPVKGKSPPPKRASKQTFGKKMKPKDGGSSGGAASSGLALKIGSSRPSARLNPAAPKVDLRQSSSAAYTQENIGTVFETPSNVTSQLYALDVLQSQGGYQYFSQLATVIREPSVDLSKVLVETPGPSDNRRIILDGPAGSGKSIVMLQAIALALQLKWVVVSIPRAELLIDSSQAYAWDEKRGTWRQDVYMSELLGRIAEANKDVLQLQNTSKTFSFDRHTIPEKATLHKLVEIGSKDPTVAHAIYDAFIVEMNLEGRPELLLTMDNLSITTVPSKYRDQEFRSIHPFDLEVVGRFVDYLNGNKRLTNGVVVTNTSSRPACTDRALQIALGHARLSPFEVIDQRISAGIQGARVIAVNQYSSNEAKSVVQHYASAGLIRGYTATDITESLVKQRTMMGGGLGREVLRSCLKQL